MFNKYPLLSRFGIFFVFPIIILCVCSYLYLTRNPPLYVGEIIVQGLSQSTEVKFDENGIPTILGSSDEDVYFSQGYIHASERMWQMELQRRLAAGKLSEVFGKDSLSTDVFMRTLDLYGSAEKSWIGLSDEAKIALKAYSEGVNAWINGVSVLPAEFGFMGVNPAFWTEIDSLAWQKVFSLNLSLNMNDEINRLAALKIMTPDQLKTFYPYDPNANELAMYSLLNTNMLENQYKKNNTDQNFNQFIEVETTEFEEWFKLDEVLAQNWSIGNKNTGSNAWVVAGRYTQSKLPIIANDPHLGIQYPSVWYAMQLKGSKLNVSGMSMVGLPGIIIGRNSNIAWGITNLMSDQQDLFVLEIPFSDYNTYLTNKGAVSIESKKEVINIRPEFPGILHKKVHPIEIQVRNTSLGPIISDVINKNGEVIVLRWTALDKTDTSYDSFYQLQYAQDWTQFRKATKLLKSPGLNFLYADNKGNFGSQVAGHFPIRGRGVGILPQSAFDTSNYWKGYVPFEELPSQYNPDKGFIVSANSKVEHNNHVVLSHEWAPETRKNRIAELLNKKINNDVKLSIADMISIQMDQVDLGSRKLVTMFKNGELRNEILTRAPIKELASYSEILDEIASWNAEYNVNSIGASIYHYWVVELKKQIFTDDLETSWSGFGKRRLSSILLAKVSDEMLFELLSNKQGTWCSSLEESNVYCKNELLDSFVLAVNLIRKHTKSNALSDWSWGSLHTVRYSHKPLGELKFVETLFSVEIPVGGSENTINVANAVSKPAGGFKQTLGAMFRLVFDMGKGDVSAYSLSTGQSGHLANISSLDVANDFIDGVFYKFNSKNEKNNEYETSKGSLVFIPAR